MIPARPHLTRVARIPSRAAHAARCRSCKDPPIRPSSRHAHLIRETDPRPQCPLASESTLLLCELSWSASSARACSCRIRPVTTSLKMLQLPCQTEVRPPRAVTMLHSLAPDALAKCPALQLEQAVVPASGHMPESCEKTETVQACSRERQCKFDSPSNGSSAFARSCSLFRQIDTES